MSFLCRASLAGIAVGWGLASMAFAQRGPAVVEILPIAQRHVATTQATLGTIMPTRRAVIGSAVDGRVVEFLVREGDRVETDQPLARLLTATIALELEAAEAEWKLRQQELVELKNGSQELEIEQARARLEASRVLAEYLEKDTRRLSQLGANSAISASEVEDSHSRWLAAQQRYIEAQAAYQLAVDGPRPERIAQAEFRVAMQAAVAEKLKDQIGKHTLYSRFAGYVTVEHTEVGQWLPRGEPVAEIIALDEVDVLARVIEAHIPFIHVGDKATVEVPALGGRKLEGTVAAIIPEADERSRTFPVKVRVANEFNAAGEPLLKAGMLARADLATGNQQTVLMVPKDALVLGGKSTLIWTIDSASIEPAVVSSQAASASDMLEANAQAIPVQTGVEQDDWIEVRGDIAAGTAVVVRGNERIPPARPGAPPSRVTWRGN
ncbi:MAG: efflux RND transporter periplasmic adaptor subunit [Pirellulaceae bacterium]|nr:efflux RND transporter periplasmic adaptor subunit [Pirellulaceae bacterium]